MAVEIDPRDCIEILGIESVSIRSNRPTSNCSAKEIAIIKST